ncbi:LamG-like jellyroll fold domain-containing protein [Kitasatospora fiedleri]|uniref:LamG-like jellyroll fold domain-containing protein n=1 Tax=Kitasatospora fiedleri TaxID=2991545 RepID=UPI00249BA8F4|nr:LamG-like jellyroll fold domain-containing protein [Kitasatospora fiedleri]
MTADQVAAADRTHLDAAQASSETERALASAKSTGAQVPVPGLTTEFSETAATPQGHLYQSLHLEQQRMRKDGDWADLDATLVANSDGSYSPRVSPSGLRLSKGGGDQLATLTAPGGEQLSLTSPLPLSAPRVSGDSLTYTVDQDTELKVTATKFGGFTTVLVLKSAAAAANPALKSLRFDTRTTGVTVSSDTGDNLTATASDGRTLWHAPAPMMWDSSKATTTGTSAARARTVTATAGGSEATDPPLDGSSADGPGQGARVARMPVTTDSSGITLTPDQDLLANGTGPWYIDPAWTPTSVGNNLWNWVQTAYPTLNNDNHTGSSNSDYPGIGRCGSYPAGGSCSPASTYHTYYRFDLSALGGAVVDYAQLNLEQRYSANWSCATTYDVTAYRTDNLANGTTWNTQPTRRDYLGARQIGGTGSSGCGGNIPFNYDVTGVVGSNAGGSISFQIATANESDVNAFKRLTTGASLGVLYDKYPDVPQNPRTSPITPRTGVPNAPDLESCAEVPESSFGWITSKDLSLTSTVRSPNQGQLTEWANIWDLRTGKSAEGWSGFVTSGNQASYPLPTGFLEDGHSYGWAAKGDDGLLRGSPTPTCHFRVDLTPPTLSLPGTADGPAVTDLSTQFPPAGNGQTTTLHVGQSGTIPFTAADALPAGLQHSGVAAVHWSFNPCMCDPYVQHAYFATLPAQLPVTQLPVTPTHWGTNTVYVQVEDNAGNKTPLTPYTFSVPWSPTPLAYGDVSGDGYPDILAAGDDGRLLDYGQGVDFAAAPAAATVGQAPAGSSWKDLRTSHRGTIDAGDNVDSLFVHRDPGTDGTGGGIELFYYPNNPDRNGTFDLSTKSLGRPDCSPGVNPSCADYGSVGSWATVSQITPIGSSSATLKPTDQITQGSGVLAVEKNNLWYYPSLGRTHTNTAGQPTPFGPPTKLTSDGSWGNYDLMVPGNALADGKPALWVRARATSGTVTAGDVYQYALAFGSATTDGTPYTTVTGLTASPAGRLASGLTVAAFPQVGAVGDLNGDDIPDLWGFVGSTGRITTWVGVTTDRTNRTPVTSLSPRDRQWLLDPTVQGTDAAGSTGSAANPIGTVTWSTDAPSGTRLVGSAGLASADGRTGAGALSPNVASPGTTGSYTVSAWAKINNTDDFSTVMSQTDQTRSPFYLQYSKSAGTWAFVGTSADSAATAYYTAAANSPAVPGKWTHLVGTYDATSKIMTLYVDGTYTGSTAVPSTWASTGHLTIGANRYPDGSLDNKTAGNVADARTYPYTLSTEQVAALYAAS